MRFARLGHFFLIPLLCAAMPLVSRAADPAAEIASFSVFDKVDLAELARSPKTVHGPPMGGRYLSVQSCYVMPGEPGRLVEAMRQWDPTKQGGGNVFVHGDLPGSPSASNFARLKNAPNNGSVSAFVSSTEKLSPELQISREEAKKFSSGGGGGGNIPESVVKFWSDVLANRARLFMTGGTAAQPPYDHSVSLRPNDELRSLLKQQGKIQKQFSDFLGSTGIGRGAGSLPAEPYWELLDVDDRGVVTLGASYSRKNASGAQTADVLYYASGGYYVALTLHQMWPVTVDGKPATLVWRGDMISSAALESLHGVERLASEGAMVKDISRSIATFRRQNGGR